MAPGDLAGDLNKDLYFEVENGAVQVDTGIPASQFASVTCSSSDGRVYGTTGVDHFVETVVCLRTALGTYVKWYSMAGSTGTGGVAITWERMSSVPSGTTALCDPGWLNTDIVPSGLGLTCDSPAFPGVSNWFDFDAGQKVAPSASTADLRKEGMWEVVNGATQVDTGIPSSQFGSVVCSSSDGRPYSSGGVMYNLTTVICLRTALGVYVKWYSMAGAGGTGGSAITWTRM
ncbi:MAG: hypothetical protein RBU37_03155 [Myxococcota bacterium]|nr:hypothetical protein [Myxococcota bacterium]